MRRSPGGGPVDQRHSLAKLKGSLEGWAKQMRERDDVASLTMPMSRNCLQRSVEQGDQPPHRVDPQVAVPSSTSASRHATTARISRSGEWLTEPRRRWRQAPGELVTARGVQHGLCAHMMFGRDAVQVAVFVVPHEGQELLAAPRNAIESVFAQGARCTISGDLMQGLEGQIPTRVQDDGHLIKAPVVRQRADHRGRRRWTGTPALQLAPGQPRRTGRRAGHHALSVTA